MARRGKREQPVDRAVRELEQEIARVKRELRVTAQTPAPAPAARRTAPRAAAARATPESVTEFVRTMLAPAAREVQPTYRVRTDLFDVADTPLEQLELEPLPFVENHEAKQPELFAAARADGAATSAPTATGDRHAAHGSKLARYLSAGSIRGDKQLRRVQREGRNRFLAWIGLSMVALWVIYLVVP